MQRDLFATAPAPPARWVLFCCLNPSIADADMDDPTLRRMMGFATRLGADVTGERSAVLSPCGRYRYLLRRGTLLVVNLYAFRATDPHDLDALPEAERIGPENNDAIDLAAMRADTIIAGWGASLPPGGESRARVVLDRLAQHRSVHCLGRTAAGMPRHPLYLPASASLDLLCAYTPAATCADRAS